MVLQNKLNITDQIGLNKAEEKISKQKAKRLFESGDIDRMEIGTFKGLAKIHAYLSLLQNPGCEADFLRRG